MLISPFYPSTQRITKHRPHLYTGIRVREASNHTIVLTDYARRDLPIENYKLQITLRSMQGAEKGRVLIVYYNI